LKNDNCRKLSWKVDTNKFAAEDSNIDNKQKVWDLKKLNFHGLAVDDSLLSERISYNMLDAAGYVSLYHSCLFDICRRSLLPFFMFVDLTQLFVLRVITPRASHVKLYVNKVLFGIMSFVEAIDDQFTEVPFERCFP
jgi:hypothetical protein